MNIRLLEPALAELDEAIAWYAEQVPRLDQKFLDEIEQARRRIVEYPYAWHALGDGIRRFRLWRFPYGLIYAVEAEEIVVIAVAHLHREPTYWRSRVSK
jgi:toxin ParE2